MEAKELLDLLAEECKNKCYALNTEAQSMHSTLNPSERFSLDIQADTFERFAVMLENAKKYVD